MMRFTLEPRSWYACMMLGDEFDATAMCSVSPSPIRDGAAADIVAHTVPIGSMTEPVPTAQKAASTHVLKEAVRHVIQA